MRDEKGKRYCPEWSWWVRSGERLILGMDIRRVMDGSGGKLQQRVTHGLDASLHGIRDGRGIVDSLRCSGLDLAQEAWCLLETGEHTGRLGEAMREVGELLKANGLRRRELAGQLWYPGLVMVTGTLVMGLILFWVVPQMREVSESMGMGGRLPWLTEHIGKVYGWVFGALVSAIAVTVGMAIGLRWLGVRSLKWAQRGETIHNLVPSWGQLRRHRREARLLRQLGTLLQGGVTLPRALDMAAHGSPDHWERAQLGDFRKRLIMGSDFKDCMEGCDLIHPEHGPLLLAGQEGGRLEIYMEQIAQDLESQVSWRIRQGIRLLEPLMLLALSVAIGGLILAYMLPMVRMLEQLA